MSSERYCLTVNRSSALKVCFFYASSTIGTMEVSINWLSSLEYSLYLNIGVMVPFDERLCDLLGSHVVVSCKLHEFYDLFLDVCMTFL